MTQRNYANDRYRKDAKVGTTRKSAAKAKPVRKLGEASSPKAAAKPKKTGVEKDWSGLPTSPEIKKWRKLWWGLLLGGLALILGSYAVPDLRNNESLLKVLSLVVLALSAGAIYIDLVVIRKLRKGLVEAQRGKKKAKSGGSGGAS
ncbi:MAG: hypothetical protein EG823_02500 [Actinobacteria bacterium]|nr:hypothetical protein [Actinomycetota bacterium]